MGSRAANPLRELKHVKIVMALYYSNDLAYCKSFAISLLRELKHAKIVIGLHYSNDLAYVEPFPHDLPDTEMEFVYQSGSDKIYFDKETGWLDTTIKHLKWKEVSEPQSNEYIEMVKGIGRKHPSQYFKYNEQKNFFY